MDPIHQFEIITLLPIARIGNVEIAFTNSTKSRRWAVRRRRRGRYGDLAAGSGARVMKRGGGRPILPRSVGVSGSVNEQRWPRATIPKRHVRVCHELCCAAREPAGIAAAPANLNLHVDGIRSIPILEVAVVRHRSSPACPHRPRESLPIGRCAARARPAAAHAPRAATRPPRRREG